MAQDAIHLRDTLRTLVTEHKLNLMQQVLQQRTRHITFVFEHFYHEHNIHAAMRSIEGFGFQDVHSIANKRLPAPQSPSTASGVNQGAGGTITKGADYWLTTYTYTQNTQECFELLRKQGYFIVGTTPHLSHPAKKTFLLSELPLQTKIALVFGNERIGLSDYALEHVDAYSTIAMYGFTESFNVSASVTVAAYEVRKRLEASAINWHISEQEKFDLELTWLKRLVRGSEIIEKNLL